MIRKLPTRPRIRSWPVRRRVDAWWAIELQKRRRARAAAVPPMETGLVAYWPFYESTGTTRVDATGRGNDLYDFNSNVEEGPGLFGSAAVFDPANEPMLERPGNEDMAMYDANWTITAWVKLASKDVERMIFSAQ